MVGHVLAEMFRWPDGNVLGNLLASLIWAVPAFIHVHVKLNRMNRISQKGPANANGRPDTGRKIARGSASDDPR